IESKDDKLTGGRVGLAKFRATEAEFRSFRVAKELPSTRPDGDVILRLNRLVDELPAGALVAPEIADRFTADGSASVAVLRERAQLLEQQGRRLRQLAQSVHHLRVGRELEKLLDKTDDEEIDLFHAALLVALLDNEEVDVDEYRQELDRMAREIFKDATEAADEPARLAA